MALQAKDLFDLARQMELKVASIYESMAIRLPPGSREALFYTKMAAQEHIHAAWVDEMEGLVDPHFLFPDLSREDFTITLSSIEDFHDEVEHEDLSLPELMEITLHLEGSVAEGFYTRFPSEVPGVPKNLVKRLIRSSVEHAAEVARFRKECCKF
ncbi:MAG: hypothetical protein V1918_09810 [Planctomycetota bacterium]